MHLFVYPIQPKGPYIRTLRPYSGPKQLPLESLNHTSPKLETLNTLDPYKPETLKPKLYYTQPIEKKGKPCRAYLEVHGT